MADSGARLARRVADQERLAALTLQAQELADSFAAEDALADQEEAASLADFDQALAESLGQAVPDSPALYSEAGMEKQHVQSMAVFPCVTTSGV